MKHSVEGCQCEGKLCSQCEILHCVGQYTKDLRLKSKLKSQCKACASKKNKKWREENKEHDATRKKAWNKANPERVSATRRKGYLKNADRVKRRQREYYLKNADRVKRRQREYYLKNAESMRENYQINKEKISVQWKDYYSRNRQHLNKQSADWKKENPSRWASIQMERRKRQALAGGSYRPEEWKALKAQYNHTCLCCGKSEPEIKLTPDHVIPVAKGGTSYISNIQPLCHPCNSSKGTKVIDFRPPNP